MSQQDEASRLAEQLPDFSDPRVQTVYELICSEDAPPNSAEHWDGWISRRIVAALSKQQAPEPAPQVTTVSFAGHIYKVECPWPIDGSALAHGVLKFIYTTEAASSAREVSDERVEELWNRHVTHAGKDFARAILAEAGTAKGEA